ncbi:hypothetical protein WHT83_17760 [Aminobacter sp. P9b]
MGVARFRTGDATGSLVGSVVVATALILAIHHDQTQAHGADTGWTYPPACCKGDPAGGDCQRIPNAAVKTRPNGFVVTLYPGDHRRITRRQTFLIPYGNEIASGDRDYHICLHPTEEDVNCFFAPPDGA